MFSDDARQRISDALAEIESSGLTKSERIISTPQSPHVEVSGQKLLNLCANNYLGLANHPKILAAAENALQTWGFGLSSVRFICGTQEIHKELEARVSQFLATEDTILYSSCFDANGGLFETILGPEDAIISDALNHASIIDGIRLCKAQRFRYSNRDMAELRQKLEEARGARTKLIVTDGVFSMDGHIAPLDQICDLADEFGALVMVDDSHATGFFGPGGKGTPAHFGVSERVDIVTSTLGKALGGASGGFTSGRREIIDLLRQRSRPYLFSNSLAPAITAATIAALDLVESDEGAQLRARLEANTAKFRAAMIAAGYQIPAGTHPIVPLMIGDAVEAKNMAEKLLQTGIYVIAFSFPVVAQGKARIRVQISGALSDSELEQAIEAFSSLKSADD